MYHDRHIPVKLGSFRFSKDKGTGDLLSGVNITLGLPIVRTSVDHGTAFDIAGKGLADASSMVQAVVLAAKLAAGRSSR